MEPVFIGDIRLAKSKYIMVNRVLLVRDVSCVIFVGGGKNMAHPFLIFHPSFFENISPLNHCSYHFHQHEVQ